MKELDVMLERWQEDSACHAAVAKIRRVRIESEVRMAANLMNTLADIIEKDPTYDAAPMLRSWAKRMVEVLERNTETNVSAND